jgi:hypothetical protein
MNQVSYIIMITLLFGLTECKQGKVPNEKSGLLITETDKQIVIGQLVEKHGENSKFRIERGVKQVANLWRQSDGTASDFKKFCFDQFLSKDEDIETLFKKISYGYEILFGNFIRIKKELRRPVDLEWGEIEPIDQLFGGFDAGAHLYDDLYSNKIAFITALNYPQYSLKEKTELSEKWSRKDWAYARLGDVFTSRIPAEIIQAESTANANAEEYISEYNINLGYLVNDKDERLFAEDLKLISHWGIRDELKSQYAEKDRGLERQKMIYQVMKRIIDQTIPQKVINSKDYLWDPYSNTITKGGQKEDVTPEPDTRYQHVVKLFKALSAMDKFEPSMPTYIQRQFEKSLEIPVADVEKLFTDLISSKEVRDLGKLVEKRLDRPLEPFDIWYDGFKSRSGIPQEKLDAVATKRFSDTQTFEREIPSLLTNLNWDRKQAQFIGSKIKVEGARGSGHAWGAETRNDVALLRTRIQDRGMDYKGLNIALHELGHTVEQTISLHDVDFYMLHGVPNTAFTEALAFMFQKRDLEVLGMKESGSDKEALMALDNLWSCYEIMGVSLVDINLWKWLYQNPYADAFQVKEATITIAKDIWNKYYSDVFGSKDETILAIYSHMISYPLYLSAYPIGHLIDFQLEKNIKEKPFGTEVQRIFEQGRLIPQRWMTGAVGEPLSARPALEASSRAVELFIK